MARGDATAADVPGKYDAVVNGKGYVFLDSVEPSLPFRTHRAIYDITQTFVERQNVGNNYGDQAQDFFLTESQNDWSEGEQQRFLRSTDRDSVRRYWSGMNVDISVPGQVRIMPQLTNITFPATVAASAGFFTGIIYAAGATDLYKVTGTTVTTVGAHGLGATPSPHAMVCDGTSVYMSTTSAGTVGVRRFDTSAGTFSTFSASGSDVLALNNNTLYGIRANATNSDLVEYSTGGVLSVLFPWRTANGATALASAWMQPYGGQLAILTNGAPQPNRASLWIYDGNGVSKIFDTPPGTLPCDLCVSQGVIFLSVFAAARGTSSVGQIFFYSNGNVGLLWQGSVTGGASGPPLLPYANGILFADQGQFHFCYYDVGVGSVQTVGLVSGNPSGQPQILTGSDTTWLQTRGSGTAATAFQIGTIASSATVNSSLFDFDSSLTKLFRGVKVDWKADTTGDGGSVDIAYQVDSLDSSYTTLQTGAVSGTEYPFPSLSGHSISIQITLNKGTSTNGPTLKRVYVRGAPVLEQFRSGIYIIDCTGTNAVPRRLRDGTPAPLSGYEMVQNLKAAAQATTPFSVTDKVNGTFNALVDLSDAEGWDVYEVHPAPEDVSRPGSYVVRVKVREV